MTVTATLTHDTTTEGLDFITYANGETAMASETSIGSCPKHSEAIAYWDYKVADKMLVVRYKSSTRFYYYEEVPYTVIFGLLTADSLGAYIAKEVKPKYGTMKVRGK
jgi:hypothetical protein